MEQETTGAPAMDYARRLVRFAAFVVDVVIVSIVLLILEAAGLVTTFSPEGGSTGDSVIGGLIGLVYFIVLTSLFGATLGKMALRIRVANEQGVTPPVGKVALREFIKGGLAPVPYVLGPAAGGGIILVVVIVVAFWILIDDRRQGLHDRAAGTFVIRAG